MPLSFLLIDTPFLSDFVRKPVSAKWFVAVSAKQVSANHVSAKRVSFQQIVFQQDQGSFSKIMTVLRVGRYFSVD
jgi:hypothetical protein